MRKKDTCVLFSLPLLWVFCYLQPKVFLTDMRVQMFFLFIQGPLCMEFTPSFCVKLTLSGQHQPILK